MCFYIDMYDIYIYSRYRDIQIILPRFVLQSLKKLESKLLVFHGIGIGIDIDIDIYTPR